MPDEIRCGFELIGEEVWFQVTDEEWITRLITQENDGISVDIVLRSKFRCDAGPLPGNTMITGTLLPPKYRKDILANLTNRDVFC